MGVERNRCLKKLRSRYNKVIRFWSPLGLSFPVLVPLIISNPLEPRDAKNLLIHFASPLPLYTNPDEFGDLLNLKVFGF